MRIIAIFGGHGVPPHPRRPFGRGNFSRPAFEGGGGGGGWRLSRRPRRPLEIHRDDRLAEVTPADRRLREGGGGEVGWLYLSSSSRIYADHCFAMASATFGNVRERYLPRELRTNSFGVGCSIVGIIGGKSLVQ